MVLPKSRMASESGLNSSPMKWTTKKTRFKRDGERLWYPGRRKPRAQVPTEAVAVEALVLHHDEHDEGQAEGDIDVGGGRVGHEKVRFGDEPDDVHGEDVAEDGEDEVVVLLALLSYLAGEVARWRSS